MNNAWCEAISNHCKLHYKHMIFHCQRILWSEMVAVVEFHGHRTGMRALVSNSRTHSLIWKKEFYAKKNRRKWTSVNMVQTVRAHHCAAHSILVWIPPMLVHAWTIMWIKKAHLPCWRSRGQQVSPEVNLRNPLCTGKKICKPRNPTWFWNPGKMSPEV